MDDFFEKFFNQLNLNTIIRNHGLTVNWGKYHLLDTWIDLPNI